MTEPSREHSADQLDRLIEALQAQTAAMNGLAQSNRDLVDLVAADMDVDPGDQPERLLDGTLED